MPCRHRNEIVATSTFEKSRRLWDTEERMRIFIRLRTKTDFRTVDAHFGLSSVIVGERYNPIQIVIVANPAF